jgi:hypothetical protein
MIPDNGFLERLSSSRLPFPAMRMAPSLNLPDQGIEDSLSLQNDSFDLPHCCEQAHAGQTNFHLPQHTWGRKNLSQGGRLGLCIFRVHGLCELCTYIMRHKSRTDTITHCTMSRISQFCLFATFALLQLPHLGAFGSSYATCITHCP